MSACDILMFTLALCYICILISMHLTAEIWSTCYHLDIANATAQHAVREQTLHQPCRVQLWTL